MVRPSKNQNRARLYHNSTKHGITKGVLINLTLILLMLFVSNLNVVRAKEPSETQIELDNSCIPVDMVFVVDQSDQMSKIDRGNMRIEAIKWFFNFLGYDVLLHCPGITHRVTVINGFNSDFSSDWMLINPDANAANAYETWEADFSGLSASLTPGNGGNRSYPALEKSVRLAVETLKNAPPIGRNDRKKALVFILGDEGFWCENINCPKYQVFSEQKRLSGLLNDLDDKTSLWVITYGTSEPDFKFEEFWVIKDDSPLKRHGGQAFPLREGGVDTGQKLIEIFQALSPRPDVVNACRTFYADPFLDRLGFNILLSPNESKNVVFQDPMQTTYTFQSVMEGGGMPPMSMSGSPDEGTRLLYTSKPEFPSRGVYYLFGFPLPGEWKIDADCDNNRALVYVQIVRSSRIVIISPSEFLPQYKGSDRAFDPDNPNYLEFKIVDRDGHPIGQHAGYEAEITAVIQEPRGGELPLTFRYENESLSFISKEALPVNEAADYGVEIELNMPSADPGLQETHVSSIHYEGGYSVSSRMPFNMKIDYPSTSGGVPVHGQLFNKYFLDLRPVEVKVSLQMETPEGDEAIQPAVGDVLSGNEEQAIHAVLYDSSNNVTDEIWLQPSPTDPFVFTGAFNNEKFPSGGDYSLMVSFDPAAYNNRDFLYLSKPNLERVEFVRRDGILDAPITYLIILIILMASAALGVFLITDWPEGYLIFRPPHSGERAFAVLELGQVKWRRRVRFSREVLRKKSFLLSNLDSVEVYTPLPFVKRQEITIVETAKDQPLESVVGKRSENPIKIGTTSVNYEIHFSTNPPDAKVIE